MTSIVFHEGSLFWGLFIGFAVGFFAGVLTDSNKGK